jgi:hypothetical protein
MNVNNRTLLIDDIRELVADVTARSYAAGLDALSSQGPWDTLLLDHDLASHEDGVEKTGYDITKWIAAHMDKQPRRVILVTSNPVGRDNMGFMLEAAGYKRQTPTLFIKEST